MRLSAEEIYMDHQTPGTTAPTTGSQQSSNAAHREGRNVWVLTAYGISGLTLFGVLAYYFSQYLAN
ncbi:MAG: hypothetical protein DMG75_13220 [Acidobacteria bacterium]|nr:MAG: hypothetical protein DMG75_13220 [Acidobacteriota bacterium]